MKDFSFITELQAIWQQKQLLAEKESQLLTPLLTKLSDMELIYDLFKNLVQNREPSRLSENVDQRKKFIFIALCFFAPGTLAGYRLPHGLRATLARVLNTYPSFISDNIENVIFQYQKLKAYREELAYLYSEIESTLKNSGTIGDTAHKSADF